MKAREDATRPVLARRRGGAPSWNALALCERLDLTLRRWWAGLCLLLVAVAFAAAFGAHR